MQQRETLIGMVWVITLKYKEDGHSHVGIYSPSQVMIRLTRDSCRTQEARRVRVFFQRPRGQVRT